MGGGYEGTKRQRMIDSSNPYFAVSGVSDASILAKRARIPDLPPNPYYYPSSSFDSYNLSGSSSGGGSINSIHNFPVVRLRGLPFNCDDLDVYKFFAGLDVVDCLLVNKNGRFSGEAFVVLSSPMQAELALGRNRQNLGRRYVEVFKCIKYDYYHAIANEVTSGGSYDTSPPPPRSKKSTGTFTANNNTVDEEKEKMEYTQVLKLRGLPYSATVSDIIKFFGEFEIKEDKVHIAKRPDGKATGEAYVEFESADVAKKAMCKDKNMIGSRYVELFPSTIEDQRRAVSRFRQ